MLPFVYAQAFRKVAPERAKEFENAEREIWREFGRKQSDIARALGLPVNSATEVAEALTEISTTVLGPRLKGRWEEAAGDAAVLITEQCPMADNTNTFGKESASTCRHCQAYLTEATKSLNPDYQLTAEQHICMGDPYCLSKIERVKK
jgi:predicted ArsR family transcriptional regulator